MRSELGLVHVYTGEGKGKTTAALGLAVRAWGHGLRVCVIQFMKSGEDYGEIIALRRMEGIDVFQFGSDRLITKESVRKEDIELAEHALEFARNVLSSNDYDVVILDEVNVAMFFGLISPRDVIDVVRSRKEGTEVVLTGRNAPKEVLDEADLVTRMVAEKHPYDEGVIARKGVEY
ncbi:MAG: cob(I)yrinic acid a,c-diamide adenosyltransferase [Methanomassiliicoccales archaeon]|nr:MAG: cob(I)yrinic acid a,c-diamide adenosyltransferase [Methanomassiliicoccales archaeon]